MDFHPDAIPSNEQIRETLADRIYHPYKRVLWTVGCVLAALVIAFLYQRDAAQRHLDEQWSRFEAATTAGEDPASRSGPTPEVLGQRLAQLDNVLRDYPSESVTPWAMHAKVRVQLQLEDHDGALATLGQLKSQHSDFAFCRLPMPGIDGAPRTLADHVEDVIAQEAAWAGKTTYVHTWPEENRLALVETSAGKFWMAFYEGVADAHVAAFVERAKRGDYNGRQVYEIRRSSDGTPQVFLAGSPASGTAADPAEHDRDEPTDTIEPEAARHSVRHQQRIVSAVSMPSGESASSFMVITAPDGMRRFDGESTPFAAVIDREGSLDAIQKIANGTTYDNHPRTAPSDQAFRVHSHPYPYVLIHRVTIWSEEKLEEGHTWDTARVDSGDPEPGQAEIKPWLPSADKDEESGDDSAGGDDSSGEDEGSDDSGPDDE